MSSYTKHTWYTQPAGQTLIQTTMDSKIWHQIEICYKHLNKKLDYLQQKQPKISKSPGQEDNPHFYTRVKSLTNIRFKEEEMQLLKYELNYSTERPISTYVNYLLPETE